MMMKSPIRSASNFISSRTMSTKWISPPGTLKRTAKTLLSDGGSVRQRRAYRYSRRCLTDPPSDRSVFAVRFKVPGGEIHFVDMVRGDMKFDADLIGDLIIMKDRK